MSAQKEVRLFGYWQIIYSVTNNLGRTAKEHASFLGVSESRVYRAVQSYNLQGAAFCGTSKWGGRRDATSLLTPAQESEFLKGLESEAREGKILVGKHIKDRVEEKVKQQVSQDYIWDLFKRHGWKKKSPRPEHPGKDPAAQEEFKKNFTTYWFPTA